MRTHYDNLKVPETATRDAIKSAYRQLCLKHHPDRNPGNADSERIMCIVNDAYAILSDPAKRRAYDQELTLRRTRDFQPKDPSPASASREAWKRHQQSRAYATTGGPYYQSRPDPRPPYQSPMWANRAPPHDAARTRMRFTLGMSMLIVIMVAANLYHKDGAGLPFSVKGLGEHVKEDRSRGSENSAPAEKLSLLASLFSDNNRTSRLHETKSKNLLHPDSQASFHPPSKKTGTYVRPATAPNGAEWPMIANYVRGYPQEATKGESRITLDNTENGDDVFVKLIALRGGRAWQVRTCFLPAATAFSLMKLEPGDYELRYQNLATGEIRATDIFPLKETKEPLGIKYTTLRMALFNRGVEDVPSREIAQGEF